MTDTCVICIENCNIKRSDDFDCSCGVYFHDGCFTEYIKRMPRCPICQKDYIGLRPDHVKLRRLKKIVGILLFVYRIHVGIWVVNSLVFCISYATVLDTNHEKNIDFVVIAILNIWLFSLLIEFIYRVPEFYCKSRIIHVLELLLVCSLILS